MSKDLQDHFAELREGKSDVMTFEVHRDTPEAGKTFSLDALNEVMTAVRLFVGARLASPHHSMDKGHRQMLVEVRVTIDSKSTGQTLMEAPWFTVDGGPRADA